jgi:2-deoxy-D-gluconate 3-dehydrogenase
MIIDLKGKVALVTGASRGIGKAIADGLQNCGASVARTSKTRDFLVDLTNPLEREGLIETMLLRYGRIDILVNNAGDYKLCPAESYPLADWNAQIELMLTAPFHLAQMVIPGMKERGWGRIINIASVVSFQGSRNTIAYTAAKHGIIGVTRSLSNEFAPYGIRVNAIAPGFIETDMLKPLTDDPKHYQEMLGRIPAKRFGFPSDVVGAAIFLASDMSEYITGSCIMADGGWSAR